MYARWIKSIEKFPYVFKHKSVTMNKVADAVSTKVALYSSNQFDSIKDLYSEDADFGQVWPQMQHT